MEKGWNKVFVSQDKRLTTLLTSLLDKEGVLAVSINKQDSSYGMFGNCLLYTSDAADEGLGVDLGGRRSIKKK